jgi:branched-chain amino acid transport system substrate-binding protein
MRPESRVQLFLASSLAAVVAASSGCGGSRADVIRIGVLSDCESSFSSQYEATIAGAELPLLRRGARLRGPKPSDGLTRTTVAGKPVELVVGCVREFSRASTLAALRELVEQKKVDIVAGPNGPGDGLVVRDYAKREPGVTFVYAGFDGSVTVVAPAPNVFRFRVTMAQWGAGLGAYAYHVLGWRNAVTISNIEPAPAGFIAEFCSLGGNIVQRLSAGDDLAALVPKIKKTGVDGVFLPTSLIFGLDTGSFVAAWAKRHPDLNHWLVAGDGIFTHNESDRRLLGVVFSNPTPWAPTRSWTSFADEFAQAFPGVIRASPSLRKNPQDPLDPYNAVEATLEALEQVHGDMSHGERRLMNALAALHYASPEGMRRLDRSHQAIAASYLGKMVLRKDGKPTIRQIRVVRNVDQTFGGYLSATTPVGFSNTQPPCKHGHPPSWAK